MILSTENAGGLLGVNNATGASVKVRILIGTRVESLSRDVKAGEIVTISQKDAAFLLPYSYATRDLEEAVEADEPVDTDETVDDSVTGDEDETETTDETVDDSVTGDEDETETTDEDVADTTPTPTPSQGKRSGKRR